MPRLERKKGEAADAATSSLEEARLAERDGADYLGVGAMNPTMTKSDADTVTVDELKAIRAAISIPIVIIGGINLGTIGHYKGIGVDGIAVVSAVVAADDPERAARELRAAWLA